MLVPNDMLILGQEDATPGLTVTEPPGETVAGGHGEKEGKSRSEEGTQSVPSLLAWEEVKNGQRQAMFHG